MKNNRQALKVFTYVLKAQKKQFIWKHIVLYKSVMIGGLLLFGFGIMFGELFDNPLVFFINSIIQLVLLIGIGILQGFLSFDVYKEMTEVDLWTARLRWKYILSEGIIGWGFFCGVITQNLYPPNGHTWISIIVNSITFTIGGLCFGGFMTLLWNFNQVKELCKQINTTK